MKLKHYFQPTYKMNFYFAIGWKPKAVAEAIKEVFKVEYDAESFEGLDGKCISVLSPNVIGIVIWTAYKRSEQSFTPTIAHECLHATNMTLKDRGVKADFDNDEPQTYLMTELIEKAQEKN